MNTKIYQLVLAIYQICGGAFGIYLNVYFYTKLFDPPAELISLFTIATLLFLYSIICGILLLKGNDPKFKYTVINQYLQLISFAVGGYTYSFVSMVYFLANVDFTSTIQFNFSLGMSVWNFSLMTESQTLVLSLNLVALFIIILINNLRKQNLKNKNLEELEESQLGVL